MGYFSIEWTAEFFWSTMMMLLKLRKDFLSRLRRAASINFFLIFR